MAIREAHQLPGLITHIFFTYLPSGAAEDWFFGGEDSSGKMKTTPCNSPLCGVFQGCRCWAGLSLLPPMVAFHGASCQPQSPRLSSLTLLLPPPIRVCFQPLSSFRKELALCYFILNLSSSASLLCVCEMHRSLPLQNHLHMLFYENLSYWLPLHPPFQNCPVTSSVTWVIIFWHLGLLTCKICS